MKYLARSIKYFFYFSIICAAMVSVLVLVGAAEGNINSLFKDGYKSIGQIALFFLAVAAIYPKLGFTKSALYIKQPWSLIRETTVGYMQDRRYVIESETENSVTFRLKSIAARIIKMNEDRITLTWDGNTWHMEGLRKDVIRLSSGLEHRLTPKTEE